VVGRRGGRDAEPLQLGQDLAFHEPAEPDGVLGFDEHLHGPRRVESELDERTQFEKFGGLFGGAVVVLGQLVARHLADDAYAVGGAIDRAIVDAHEVAVLREPHIAFEPVGTLSQREFVRGEGVFGLGCGRTTMRDDERSAPIGAHEANAS
jgi:hypothetical protein